MIKTIADILKAFSEEEAAKLAEYKITHGPTIGDMYEGLSAEIINRSIPQNIGLRVVDGFVHDGLGNLSGQIDCMLTVGDGEKIPYTDSYKWHVKDVTAVFEVKKTLYSEELADSFVHLREITNSFTNWVFEGKHNEKYDISPSLRAFSKITGTYAPEFHDRENLPEPIQLIYHTLITEQLSPIKIVLGYGGYKSEKGLRDGLYNFLEGQGPGQGFGVPSFPHLITCNGISLIKLNGQPYMVPMTSDYWEFYGSSSYNPLKIMLELLWTKISHEHDIGMPWDDDLETEVVSRFLSAKPIYKHGCGGWMLNYSDTKGEKLKGKPKSAEWEPIELTMQQFIVVNLLCKEGSLDTNSDLFNEIVNDSNLEKQDFIKSLTSTSYVAIDGINMKLTTLNCTCAILPTGKFVMADTADGNLFKYIQNKKPA